MKKILTILIILAVLIVIALVVKIAFYTKTTLDVEESLRKTTAAGEIQVDVQPIGSKVIISHAKLTKSGFIVIETLGQSDISIIGISELLDSGEYDNVTIQLNTIVRGQKLLAGLWHDDGDGEFSHLLDSWQLSEEDELRVFQQFDVKTR